MKIQITFQHNDKTESHMIFENKSWRFEGITLDLRQRHIWLMHTIQELLKEFKKRAESSEKIGETNK